jgi:hypothetical protein
MSVENIMSKNKFVETWIAPLVVGLIIVLFVYFYLSKDVSKEIINMPTQSINAGNQSGGVAINTNIINVNAEPIPNIIKITPGNLNVPHEGKYKQEFEISILNYKKDLTKIFCDPLVCEESSFFGIRIELSEGNLIGVISLTVLTHKKINENTNFEKGISFISVR